MSFAALGHRQLASILGGKATPDGRTIARHAYRLGSAPAPDAEAIVVTLIGKVNGVAITFEARDFEHAFERAWTLHET